MQLAQKIFGRLSECEKIALRAASEAGVEYLADTVHRSDMPDLSFADRAATLLEVQALCKLEMATKSGQPGFASASWLF